MAYQKAKLLLPFYQIDNINYHQVKIQVYPCTILMYKYEI